MNAGELDPTTWRLVYDVRQTFPWFDLLVVVGLGIFVLGWVRFKTGGGFEEIAESWDREWIRSLGTMLLGLILTFTFTAQLLVADLNLRSDVRAGRCEVLEGIVTDFRTDGAVGRGAEGFRLETATGPVEFRYGPMVLEPGYSRLGGGIANGARLRLCTRAGDIGRLEIAE